MTAGESPMTERAIKLVLDYDGGRFAGWQVQPGLRTVQQEVEAALATVLRHPVRVTAAGRTDAGVHATGQVVSFATVSDIAPTRLRQSMNGVLPKNIVVVDAADAPAGFNARFDAVSRSYRYTIATRRVAVGRAYVWEAKGSFTRELLRESVRSLSGVCSLEGFSKRNDDEDYSTLIHTCGWRFEEHLCIFEISAIRFFRHAVRSIVGTAVSVARGKESPDLIRRIIETGDRSLAGPLAPAQGLCLTGVAYGDHDR